MSNKLMRPCKSYEWVIRDSLFTRIQEVKNCTILQEFYEKVIMEPSGTCKWMLPHFSNLYVLVASYGSEQKLKPSEHTWKQILSSEQYEFLKRNGELIIGYMMVDDTQQSTNTDIVDYHFLHYIDTRVRGNNIAAFMLYKYFDEKETILIPLEIMSSTETYWQRYMDEFDIDADMYVRESPHRNLKLSYT